MINYTSMQSVSQGPIHPYIIPLKPITESAMAYFCSALNCSFGPTAPWLILINGHEQQLNKLQWPENIQDFPIKAGCFSLCYWLLHSIQTSPKSYRSQPRSFAVFSLRILRPPVEWWFIRVNQQNRKTRLSEILGALSFHASVWTKVKHRRYNSVNGQRSALNIAWNNISKNALGSDTLKSFCDNEEIRKMTTIW